MSRLRAWWQHLRLRHLNQQQTDNADFLRAYRRQLPDLRRPLGQHRLLAFDLEMTGLDHGRDQIISIGWVPIVDYRIRLAEARYYLLGAEVGVGQSAVIHGLRDQDLVADISLDSALEQFYAAAAGHVLVAHHAPLDLRFLVQATRQRFSAQAVHPCLDTLLLEQARRQRRQQPIASGELTLTAVRNHYGLPEHAAHDALSDAVATAELLLAMYCGERRHLAVGSLTRLL